MLTLEMLYEQCKNLKNFKVSVDDDQIENSGGKMFTFNSTADVWHYNGYYIVDKLVKNEDGSFRQMQIGNYDSLEEAADVLLEHI